MNSTPQMAGLQNLFEMAWCLSRTYQNDLVLCKDFLPWMDIAVSANTGGLSGLSPYGFDPAAMQARWSEAADFVFGCNEAECHSFVWTTASSFGYMRCWPTNLRDQAIELYGPFRLTIDAFNPLQH